MKRVAWGRSRNNWFRSATIDRLEPRAMMAADTSVTVAAASVTGDLALNGALNGAEAESDLVADFSLVDVNPNSARYGEHISPRDYLGSLSGFYFGHAT